MSFNFGTILLLCNNEHILLIGTRPNNNKTFSQSINQKTRIRLSSDPIINDFDKKQLGGFPYRFNELIIQRWLKRRWMANTQLATDMTQLSVS